MSPSIRKSGRSKEETLEEGIYIYCIIESKEPLLFGAIGIGGRGDDVYTVSFQDIGAVVSKSPVKKYPVARENLMPHEEVIEEVMKTHTVLPVRFATIAEDEEKVRWILEREHHRFVDLLKNMQGKKELALKLMFKEDLVYKEILEKYDDIKALKEKIAPLSPEKSHHQRMEIGRMVEAALQKERESHKEDVLSRLSPLSEQVKTNNTYGELMIINAAFLVTKEKEKDFDVEVQGLADRFGDKVRFKYVGTLPPFNFVNLVISMEKR
ncbi:MAG: gas vesicle synthesis GvpLGvpF [Syntrophus sp. (in: bacteria)]|nr:gas vesicle synthesis GvpLGvpF [Syntrophus sp. (in: bacteria)]